MLGLLTSTGGRIQFRILIAGLALASLPVQGQVVSASD